MRCFAMVVTSLLQLASLAACALAGSAVPTSLPASTLSSPVNLTMADKGRTLTLPVGSELDVTLQTVGPGEYATPQVSSPAVRFLAVSIVTPVVPAGPTQLFRFAVAAAGQATISIQSTGNNPEFDVVVKTP